tara:strand:+ start:514 stop:813 length:300 start_codon:yes stop_codon:yes gene_type:complete
MIFFWSLYLLISLIISYLLSLLADNRILKAIIFSLSLSSMCAVWFKIPGENLVAPIISIFLLESTILENNGLERILRPLILISFFLTSITLFFVKKSKN